jgi:hypothetical protein
MEDLVKTYFHEKVFFSAQQMQVELKLENWKERLVSENLADEESKVEGKVELTMYITVENDA